MLFNYHTHTTRCNHAVGADREYVENAVKNGVKTLGFSDHAPYVFPENKPYSTFRMAVEKRDEYVASIRALAKEYEKDIRILCGFELEYYPAWHDQETAFLKEVNPDYLILGQHLLGNEERVVHTKTEYRPDEVLSSYVTQTLEGLKTGDFLYLAHPDIAGYLFSETAVSREYLRLCEGAKALHIPLEINLLGIRSKRQYPNRTLFKIAAEVGNEVIIGCDAHEPQHAGDLISEKIALEMVNELGLRLIDKPLI